MNINILFVVAAKNNTNITVYKSSTDSNTTSTLNEVGEFLTLSTTENEVMHIITSGPVIVAQYTQSGKILCHYLPAIRLRPIISYTDWLN